MNMLLMLVLGLVSTGERQYAEPDTGAYFHETLRHGELEYHLTGADVRRVAGSKVYALAHYTADLSAVESSISPASRLARWISDDRPKCIVIKGLRDVPARGIRYSWNQGLERVGYRGSNYKSFINAFSLDFSRNSELCLFAPDAGTLIAVQDGREIGRWNDADLVRAIWTISIGERAELSNRLNLASRSHLKPVPGARRDG